MLFFFPGTDAPFLDAGTSFPSVGALFFSIPSSTYGLSLTNSPSLSTLVTLSYISQSVFIWRGLFIDAGDLLFFIAFVAALLIQIKLEVQK